MTNTAQKVFAQINEGSLEWDDIASQESLHSAQSELNIDGGYSLIFEDGSVLTTGDNGVEVGESLLFYIYPVATDSDNPGSSTSVDGYTLSDEGSAELSYAEAKDFAAVVRPLRKSFDSDFALVAEACGEQAVIKVA